jgi:putative protease
MAEVEIGKVADYFAKIGVVAIDLTGELKVGDTIHIKGHTTDFTQTVDSMQVEHEQVESAGPGSSIGIKVKERCRHTDHVFKVTEEE